MRRAAEDFILGHRCVREERARRIAGAAYSCAARFDPRMG
jgi:hypothetical protein